MAKARSKEKSGVIDSINNLAAQLQYFDGSDFLWFRLFPGKHIWKNIQQQLGPHIYVRLEFPCQVGR